MVKITEGGIVTKYYMADFLLWIYDGLEERVKENMKKLGYLLFAFFFLIGRIFPVKQKKVVLFNGHNYGLNGNLLEIKRAMEQQQSQQKVPKGSRFTFLFFSKHDLFSLAGLLGKIRGAVSFFVVLPIQMATAGRVFLNDNFLPFGYCRPSKDTQVVQLWHGAGAFKKFGLPVEGDEEVKRQVKRANTRITHLFITSKQVLPFYQEAFGIKKEHIYVTGIPITDVYFDEEKKKQGREEFYRQYPQLEGKKLLLYTPTFRNTEEENIGIMEHFDVQKIHQVLGSSWVILVKFHPKYPVSNITENSFCYNMTNYSQMTSLYFVSDLLITDYSSTIVEYVLLDKPIIMYAYDLKKYDRGFYREYETTVPGPVAHNEEELLAFLQDGQKEDQKRQNFARLQYDDRDGESAKRILSVLDRE